VTRDNDPILVVGGGLGGASVSLALARKGFRVRLIEQAPEFGVIGYGIQLGPNVFPMFDRLGVSEAVLAKSIVPESLVMFDSVDGGLILSLPTGASFERRFKRSYILIHRVDLHRILLDACEKQSNIELMPLTGLASYEDRSERVRLRTDDNRTIEGAALIGADGLRSTVRQQMRNEGEPRMIGYVAHRTIVPMADVAHLDVRRNAMTMWSGPGFHMITYPLRAGTLFNIVAVFRTSTYAERGDIAGYRAELDRTYSGSHPTMKGLLAMMDLERRWAISDRDPIRHWSKGLVTLVGDAAHPTLQSLAQGACMAIEDAATLAECIEQADGDFASAFRAYENARYLRTARVQYESRYLWDNLYHVGGIEREVMRAAASKRTEQDMFDCVAWLYDGFPLPAKRGAAA
jgi:salicylate hydroxylase